MVNIDSEFRSYGFITKSLGELGWDTRNPARYASGQVYTQNEALRDPLIGELLKGNKPENVVRIDTHNFWTIEAKKDHTQIGQAVQEAKDYADLINESGEVKCRLATGIAGTEEDSYLVETYFLKNDDSWERVSINDIDTTGFLDYDQVQNILNGESGNLKDEVISEELFLESANRINEILHRGAINKKNRARVISSLLLALVRDEYMPVSQDPTTLIEDINSRVRSLLRSYNKEGFAQEIEIHLPTSKDNHVKNRRALVDSLQLLRNMNIKSALNSGTDLLGQFYEIFLKYANDSKEIGIVLTPRHITRFAAEIVNVNEDDYVYDPTCGTGGFLVSSFDKVKRESPRIIDEFKTSHVYGVDQDAEVVGLAIVNMIFRGDGNSNIYEGNTFDNLFVEVNGKKERLKRKEYEKLKEQGVELRPFISKVLMNPPFAQAEKEYQFVDHALSMTRRGGHVVAIIPTSVMASNNRGEIEWRKELLKRHTLKAVIKLSEDLFLPNAHKGTYAVVIKAWEPHDDKEVVWSLMDDGFVMKKAKRMPSDNMPSNISLITDAVKAFVVMGTLPEEKIGIISHSKINFKDEILDCSPEAYMPNDISQNIDISKTSLSLASSLIKRKPVSDFRVTETEYKMFSIGDIFDTLKRGDCPPLNKIKLGNTPVVSTTEAENGIDGYYSCEEATLFESSITIPANGSKYQAFFHPYAFYALPDILVCKVKDQFEDVETKIYLCAVINQSSWRYSYFRKANDTKLRKDLQIPLPIKDGNIDFDFIKSKVHSTVGYNLINKMDLI